MRDLSKPLLAIFLCASAAVSADELKLKAPKNWGGETIKLPPGFAPDMTIKGVEHIRFAPGMMDAKSDTFFCYAFVFEINEPQELSEKRIQEEFLTYYRGLSRAVLNGRPPEIPIKEFRMTLKKSPPEKDVPGHGFTGKLKWVEPFATQKQQELNLEIHTWNHSERTYLFACVSPQKRDAEIWGTLRKIRKDYRTNQAAE